AAPAAGALEASLAGASQELVERIAWEVVPQLTEAIVRERITAIAREVIERIAWEVVPELTESILRDEVERQIRQKRGA
ncbi:MAG TPA: hypothetical protein VGD74_10260, partial [Vulgatibacter sp.]